MSKYRAKITEYKGVKYSSQKEAQKAWELDQMLNQNLIKRYERQVKFPLVVNGEKIATYVCDFKVIYNNGKEELIEIKGVWTPVAKLKLKLFTALYLKDHPDIKYTIE